MRNLILSGKIRQTNFIHKLSLKSFDKIALLAEYCHETFYKGTLSLGVEIFNYLTCNYQSIEN